ncbi:magnesium and cobalt transport protein CorA [Planosporangium mesophilum]|uniref:Magnesium transport protein CorA n=1 Tax=Planosporangium mesophilum TaxID=689768 RepID=A0A8J3T8A0_9ACTN|nr:magnesium and cobalt transport protein CorA [Planosporangium mesophilum]NJC82307.1 magnesium and cobalt transport protein CorA [Planosporangium mesophilum]GII22360.1 magnesium transport protein CorA [Planosporangium mesophilum]
MVHDDGTGRSLSRALAAPVRRAMDRMRSAAPTVEITDVTTGHHSGVVDCALYVDGVRQPGDWNYRDALTAARGTRDAFVWLGLKEPDAHELADIADAFDLHELPVEDAVKSHQRPKVERYGDMTFVTMRTARYIEHAELTETSEVVESGDVMMFIGEHFIITVRHGDAARLAPVRAGLNDKHDLLKQGPWAVAYAVYDLVVDILIEVASAIEEDIAIVEDSVFARQGGSGRIQRIYQLKRELMEFKRAVLPLQRPLAGLASGQLANVPAEIRRYFRDVNDHLTRTVEQVMYFDDLLNSILQARLAQVTVDQNNDMRKIAAWAGIAAFWTFVTGIYGMNLDMPEKDWKYFYPVLLALMVAISLGLYRAFRRSGWL